MMIQDMQGQAYIQRIAAEVVPPAIVVPSALLLGYTLLYRVHHFWRWIRVGLLWSNPDNFVQLTAGAALNMLAGDKLAIRIAALGLWIPTRITECVNRYTILAKSYQKWVEAIRGDFPRSPEVRWVKNSRGRLWSPSSEIYWKEAFAAARIRCMLIIKRTCKLVKNLVVLSMVSVDAVEALSLNRAVCDRAVNEMFLNGFKGIKTMHRGVKSIKYKLMENQPLVNKFFRWIGAHYTVDRLLQTIDTADRVFTKVISLNESMLADLGRHAIFDTMAFFNMGELCPDSLIPGDFIENLQKQDLDGEFIPVAKVSMHPVEKKSGKRDKSPPVYEIYVDIPPPLQDEEYLLSCVNPACRLDVKLRGCSQSSIG